MVVAVAAGGAAFFLINQAQQQAGQAGPQRVAVVVAAQTIPARKIIEAMDVTVREIPIDDTNAQGIASTPEKVIGRVPAVAILQGQMVLTNLLASSTEGGQFTVLGPEESVGDETPDWRAVSMTVPDDRAVGGLLTPNQSVDVFVTASVNVLTNSADGIGKDGFYTDKSTKLSYQNMLILAKAGTYYVLKAPLDVAEEISHLAGERRGLIQPRAPARHRYPPGRRVGAGHDHQPGDHPLRPPDPGRVPAGVRPGADAAADAEADSDAFRQAGLVTGRLGVSLGQPVPGHVADPDATSDPISRR